MTTWFPCRHPEQVRLAQVLTALGQAWGVLASILLVMALGLALQIAGGFGWPALAWQVVMGTLALLWIAHRRRAGNAEPSRNIPAQQLHNLTLLGGLIGICWAVAIVIWLSSLGPDFAALAVAVLLTMPAYAVAAAYFLPHAVVAFCMPLLAAACVVIARLFSQSAAELGVGLVAFHCLTMFWFLRRNWDHFVHATEQDVERTRLNGMLRQQKEIAEQAVQLKTRFLAAASHDLRQPMHAISLYLGGLSELELPDRARRAVSDARECAHDMNDMFRSLLDISRLDAQQAVPSFSVFCVGTMLSRIEKEFAPLANSRSVRLRVRARPDHVYSDPVMVERIAQNFVSNAVRHASGGRVLATCRVVRGDTVRLAVYDNGKGIPQAKLQVIFDEFHRLDATRPPDHTGGLGLGLAIVRRLADTLRVPIQVRSTVGRGSMFAVELPLVHVHAPAASLAPSEASLAGKLVVVIDDEASILQAASFILEKAGCTVVSARSGPLALDALAASPRTPDAIICDYELHAEWKGPQVIQVLREEFNCEIPALLVTGDTAGGTAEKMARDIGVELLYKPLEAAALKSSLGSLFGPAALSR